MALLNKWMISCGFILIPLTFFAQKNRIKLICYDTLNHPLCILKTSSKKKTNTLFDYRNSLIGKGFLLTEIEPIDSTHYLIRKGPRFNVLELKLPGGKNKHLRPFQYKQFLSAELKQATNRGYPFYSIELDSLEITGNKLSASIKEITGPYATWTKLHVNTDSSISMNMLENFTGIKVGEPYQEGKIYQLTNRLRQFNYLEVIKPSEILFTKDGAELFTYIRYKKMSSLQGAIGLQPNPVTQRVGFTGELQLKLINALKRAEIIDVNWRSVQAGTSNLTARFAIPFIFHNPFGIDTRLQLYKRDSTFLELKSMLAIQYNLQNGTLIKGVYQLFNSNTLSTSSINSLFPTNAQIQTHFFGIQLQQKKLDEPLNPRKGFIYFLEGAVGNRSATTSNSTYFSTVYKFQVDLELVQPIYKRHVCKLGMQVESYFADSIYSNERIRTGGLNSLRGFNEEQIFATTKIIGTLEYRFIVDRLSYAFAFFDQGYMQDLSHSSNIELPSGIGLGFAYGTKLGTFALASAFGKYQEQPFDYREMKIHFGYTAYF